MRIAIICGFANDRIIKSFEQRIVQTMYGNVILFAKGKTIILPRNGKNNNIPPHRINHKANILALNLAGVEKVFAFEDVKSLNEKIKPGTLILPDDYVDLNPESLFEMEIKRITPELNDMLDKETASLLKSSKLGTRSKSSYFQFKSSRLETKSEAKIFRQWADIMGNAISSEATMSKEVSLPYVAICYVENYANGISKQDNRLKKNPSEEIIKKIIKSNER